MPKQFFLLDIFKGVELTIHGPFEDMEVFARIAQERRNEQDPGCDSLFAIAIEDGKLAQVPAPGSDDEEVLSCPKCGHEWPTEDSPPCPECGY